MAVVRVDDGARDLLRAFAERHGVSIAALLEAAARRLPTSGDLTPELEPLVSEARAIDAERRRRG